MADSDDEFDLMIDQVLLANLQAAELVGKLVTTGVLQNNEEGPSNKRPRGPNKERGREEGHDKLITDYFSNNPVYNDEDFKRRFRMSRRLFLRIVNDLEREIEYFKQHWDARGVKGFSALQKCTSAIRQLAYGTASDASDEYLRMSETTSRDCLENFCKGIIYLYMRQYLRKPTASDIQRIYAMHEQVHGLPGMLGSIDCMHWAWKNCPVAWRGQFHRGDHAGPTVILEAVASYYEWIWHAFFGVPGATNDIIVVNQSPVFNDLFEDKAPDSSFVANNTHYNHGYYLADGIYPEWTTFVKAFRYPHDDERRIHFKERQESARKDIERTFATLQRLGFQAFFVLQTTTMEEITEAVQNISISNDSHKKNRIQVSNTKKPLFFYVNLAKRYMQQHNEVELSALGMAIATVVTIAEILKNSGFAVEKKIMTSTVDMKDESRGRPIQKAKIEILLGKTDKFDELMAAAEEERELANGEEQR
ncbi:hypothetical protein OSB04_015132 [Centaurea solstitialis]|uniref:DNA/RNA-binding protein Alba-like domain-containing protein n=3 Tax=Magnoliopsida TaxID=3398 RepID=A0AA38W8M9_9ASTR|nr:hypothetical protein OSB04_015132 [Centaurea solstitialis]